MACGISDENNIAAAGACLFGVNLHTDFYASVLESIFPL
tara:strand:+ start:104007 stop:104123 length:117 start_codon:yes stop_codon:yes gene_type:complete